MGDDQMNRVIFDSQIAECAQESRVAWRVSPGGARERVGWVVPAARAKNERRQE